MADDRRHPEGPGQTVHAVGGAGFAAMAAAHPVGNERRQLVKVAASAVQVIVIRVFDFLATKIVPMYRGAFSQGAAQ